jgi:hypothetical protein
MVYQNSNTSVKTHVTETKLKLASNLSKKIGTKSHQRLGYTTMSQKIKPWYLIFLILHVV